MKTCISLYSFWQAVRNGRLTHFEAIDKAKELGLDAVDFTVVLGVKQGGVSDKLVNRLVNHRTYLRTCIS